MMTLVLLLEEPSAKEMFIAILPKILPEDVTSKFIIFEGKQDLEKQLVRRLRGWRAPNTRFLIMRDQDAGNCCRTIKQNLFNLCREAGKPNAIVRIACHEFESFYLGDLQAVEKGLVINGLSRLQNNQKFREPDNLSNPAQQLIGLTKKSYQKISGSRAIGPHLDLENNRSHSFGILLAGIRSLVDAAAGDNHAVT